MKRKQLKLDKNEMRFIAICLTAVDARHLDDRLPWTIDKSMCNRLIEHFEKMLFDYAYDYRRGYHEQPELVETMQLIAEKLERPGRRKERFGWYGS